MAVYHQQASREIKIHYFEKRRGKRKKMMCGRNMLHKHTTLKHEVTCLDCKSIIEGGLDERE